MPFDWATVQNNLGVALGSLGMLESDTAHLEEADAASRAALEEQTRGRVPFDWAGTQNNLGVVLKAPGERESGTAHLEEAVTAYVGALEIFEAAQASHYALIAQNNLKSVQAFFAEQRHSLE